VEFVAGDGEMHQRDVWYHFRYVDPHCSFAAYTQ